MTLPAAPRLLAACALLALLALLPAAGSAQRRPAREAVRERVAASREDAIRRGLPPRAATFALQRDLAGRITVSVFVNGDRGVEATVNALGGTVGARAGGWFTARVPFERLGELARTRGVRAIEPARYAEPLEDWSKIDIGAVDVRRRGLDDQWEGATGRGAIVGVVDTGIDYEHPDFFDDDVGRSRVLWLWDQTGAGPGPGSIGGQSFSYGVECTREMMSGSPPACRQRDSDGHGTHVAGTAAGDGSASRRGTSTYSFTGVAPGADLVVVKTDYSYTGIADAVSYIFRRAEQLGRPAAVNLSLGADFGPHDGKGALSLMIDSMSGPGRIVVAAAGNSGRNIPSPPTTVYPYPHADTIAAPGDSAEIHFAVPSYSPRSSVADIALVAAYYPPSDQYHLTVVRPNGSRVEVPFAPTAMVTSHDPDGSVFAYHGTAAEEDAAVGVVLGGGNTYSGFLAPASPRRVVELYLGDWRATGTAAPRRGTWRLVWRRVTAGSGGEVDAYLVLSTLVRDTVIGGEVYLAEPTFTRGATNRRMIGPPGDAGRAITVAAYNTDSGEYAAANGITGPYRGFPTAKGELLHFSAPGPRTDGVLKPEIAAPGRVFSSLSRYGFEDPGDVYTDSAHVIYEGTSMATPHVTGAVALLLAERPSLTPEQVRSVLTTTARSDAQTAVSRASGDPGGRPNWSWGYGKLWIPDALGAVRPGSPLAGAVRGAASDVSREQETASSRRGTLVPIQSLRLSASDADTLDVNTLTFMVSGSDTAFRLTIAVDANRNGTLDAAEAPIATSAQGALTPSGTSLTVTLPAGSVRIPRGGTLDVLVLGIVSGSLPNGAELAATLLAEQSTATGVRSGATVTFAGQGTGPAFARTTVLSADERFEINQNPVRRSPLIMNYPTARRIEVYDFAGRLVRRFAIPAGSARTTWDLTNDGGRAVANGAYVIVADLGDQVVRRKLFVVR